jgi:hypothetical protein
MRICCATLGCLFLLLLASGCGGDPLGRQPISGSVNLDGAPLDKGTVNFHPVDTAKTSTGGPIATGKFSLDRSKGLAAGKYRVTVNAPKPGTGQAAPENTMPGDPLPVAQELIPPEWNTSSAQFVEVKDSGPNEFSFDIKSKAK